MKSLRQQMFEGYNAVAWARKALARQPERRYNFLLEHARTFYEKDWQFALGVVFGFLTEKLGQDKDELLLKVIQPP
jgi:hypothetical protein